MTFKKGNKVNLGRTPWNKGKKMNKDFCSKVSKNKKGKTFEEIYGSKSEDLKIRISNSQKRNDYWGFQKNPYHNSGMDHWNWKGGNKEYANFTKQFKEMIKLRDYSCVICGSSNRLQVHHIDYNKFNTIKENCLTLCLSCHMKTNYNRPQWISFFQSLLKERYNYVLLIA